MSIELASFQPVLHSACTTTGVLASLVKETEELPKGESTGNADSQLKKVCVIILLGLLLKYIIQREFKDLRCPLECDGTHKTCCEGNSKYFSSGRYKKGDTVDEALSKISYLAKYNERIVKWRRCFIIAFVSIVLIRLFVASDSTFKDSFLIFIIIFTLTNGMYSYYQYHLEIFPAGYIQENVNFIRKSGIGGFTVESPYDSINDTIKVLHGTRPQARSSRANVVSKHVSKEYSPLKRITPANEVLTTFARVKKHKSSKQTSK